MSVKHNFIQLLAFISTIQSFPLQENETSAKDIVYKYLNKHTEYRELSKNEQDIRYSQNINGPAF